jgi:hypothetical protein
MTLLNSLTPSGTPFQSFCSGVTDAKYSGPRLLGDGNDVGKTHAEPLLDAHQREAW